MDWFRVSNEAGVASPALLIFEERANANIRRMLAMIGDPARLRPHVKTHKLGPLVAWQLAAGITKFKCATIAEAEMCAIEHAPDVLLAMQPGGPNVARFVELVRRFPRTHFSTIADDAGAIDALDAAGAGASLILDVWLDLDCGMRRTGAPPDARALDLFRRIHASRNLRAAGLHAYDGHLHDADPIARRLACEQAFAPVLALRHEIESLGIPRPALVAGGSPTFPFHAAADDRECSPGTTVLWDFGYAEKFADLPFKPAAVLLTRVVSKPTPTRLCLDLGYKAVASENPPPRVRLLELPDAEAVMHSEEHLVIETPRAREFQVGDALHGIPRHICPTVALYHEAIAIRDCAASETWPIAARARRITI